MLEAKSIALKNKKSLLLENISLTFKSGKIAAIVGPNGAGKSSLLKVLAGLWQPQQGEVTLHGQAIHNWSPSHRAQHCGYLSQKPNVAFNFKVHEVVALGRYPYRDLSYQANQAVIQHYIDKLDLTELAQRVYGSLSGGEQQRVHFARLLVQLENSQPPSDKFLLLDEYMSHLDWAYQHSSFHYLKKIAAQGLGIVVVSHDIARLKQYADHVVVINKGRVEEVGLPEDLLEENKLSRMFGLKNFEIPN